MRGRIMVLAALATGALLPGQAIAESCEPADLASLRGWGGVWIAEGMQAPISGRLATDSAANRQLIRMVGLDAPWNEAGIARLEEMVRITIAGLQKQAGWGFPMMMNTVAPLSFVVAPQETFIISQYRDIRHVYTDGRPQPAKEDRWPTPWGNSIGCWQGDTLTIKTIDAGYDPKFNYAAPPVSDDAKFVETLRLVAPDRLESTMTVIDPALLTQPWTIHISYVHPQGVDRLIHDGDMFENDRSVTDGRSPTIASVRESERAATPRPEVRLSEAQIDRLVGDYFIDGSGIVMHVERRGGLLWAGTDPQPTLPFHAQDPLNFEARAIDMTLRFKTDAAGRVTGFEGRGPDGQPMTGKSAYRP